MIRPFFAALILVCLSPGAAPAQDGHFDWSSAEPMAAGIQHASIIVQTPRPMRIHAARIDSQAPAIRFVSTPRCADWKANKEETEREPARDFVREANEAGTPVVIAVNADGFSPWPAPWNQPTRTNLGGLAVAGGVLVSPPSDEPSFVVYDDRRVALVEDTKSLKLEAVQTAVSGFGFCLRKGEPLESGVDTNPRTGIGLDKDGRFVFLVTIDGRRRESQGATTQELGGWLRHFGAHDGINLDGGGSTTMVRWNPDKPPSERAEVLNVPAGDGINWIEKDETLEKLLARPNERFNGNHLGVAVAPAEIAAR